MFPVRRRLLAGILASLSVIVINASLVPNAVATGGGKTLSTQLLGSNEVPGPGDPDGSGTAVITLRVRGEVCYDLTWANLDPVIAAHIHAAPAGVSGPVVVPLPVTTSPTGCVPADKQLVKAIKSDPDLYYVNIHTETYPAGAIRGQLG